MGKRILAVMAEQVAAVNLARLLGPHADFACVSSVASAHTSNAAYSPDLIILDAQPGSSQALTAAAPVVTSAQPAIGRHAQQPAATASPGQCTAVARRQRNLH